MSVLKPRRHLLATAAAVAAYVAAIGLIDIAVGQKIEQASFGGWMAFIVVLHLTAGFAVPARLTVIAPIGFPATTALVTHDEWALAISAVAAPALMAIVGLGVLLRIGLMQFRRQTAGQPLKGPRRFLQSRKVGVDSALIILFALAPGFYLAGTAYSPFAAITAAFVLACAPARSTGVS